MGEGKRGEGKTRDRKKEKKVQRGRMEPGAGRLVRATDGDRGSGKVCVEEGKLALKRKDGRRASVAIDEKAKNRNGGVEQELYLKDFKCRKAKNIAPAVFNLPRHSFGF